MSGEKKLRILLIGSGGVGTMASYALETGGKASVTSVLRSNYDQVRAKGFSIDSLQHGHNIINFRSSRILHHIPNVIAEALEPFDYILVATKSLPDIPPTTVSIVAPAITPSKTTIILLQNGLNIEKPFLAAFPDNPILSGVSIISATESPPGHIQHTTPDTLHIGPFPNLRVPTSHAETAARAFVAAYNACGAVDGRYDDDVSFNRWRKLVYNAAFNSIAAVLGMGVVRMRMTGFVIDELVLPAMREVVAVAAAAGVVLPEGVEMEMVRLDPVEVEFLPSMGQDAAKVSWLSSRMRADTGSVVANQGSLG